MKGRTFKVLCEDKGRLGENNLCGRADNNIMVEFEDNGIIKIPV